MPSIQPRYRTYCFTSYADEIKLDPRIQYMVYQREKCPSTGRLHWQGYVEFYRKVCLNRVRLLFDKSHIEARKGTQQQAIDYCKKKESRVEGTEPFEYGQRIICGARTDLDSMVDALEDGATPAEILREFRGNALRHLGMIDRAARVLWRYNDDIGDHIRNQRSTNAAFRGGGRTLPVEARDRLIYNSQTLELERHNNISHTDYDRWMDPTAEEMQGNTAQENNGEQNTQT